LFVVLVDEKNAQAIVLRAVKDKLRNELAGIRDIYHVGVTLMNLDTVIEMGLPVSGLMPSQGN
jgi:hypothetical protein